MGLDACLEYLVTDCNDSISRAACVRKLFNRNSTEFL